MSKIELNNETLCQTLDMCKDEEFWAGQQFDLPKLIKEYIQISNQKGELTSQMYNIFEDMDSLFKSGLTSLVKIEESKIKVSAAAIFQEKFHEFHALRARRNDVEIKLLSVVDKINKIHNKEK